MAGITARRSWLRRNPHPVRILADGKTIEIGQGPKKWAEAEETVLSLGATRIEAIGANGATLRACNFDSEEDSPAVEGGPAIPTPKANQLGDMAQLALIIGDISDRAARRHEESYRLAFGEMRQMFAAVLERQTATEQAWQLAINQIAQLKLEISEMAGQGEDSAMGILGAAVMGQLPGPAAPPGKTNGKANGHKAPEHKA